MPWLVKTIEFDKPVKKRNKDINIIEAFESSRDNFLNFRKTMDSWKKENYEKLYNRLRKSKDNVGHSNANYPSESRFISSKRKNNIRLIKQNSLENALINPNEQNIYPRYFFLLIDLVSFFHNIPLLLIFKFNYRN